MHGIRINRCGWNVPSSVRLRFITASVPMVLLSVLALFFVLDRFVYPLPPDALVRPHAQFVYGRDGRLLNAFTSSDRFWRRPVRLDDIPPLLVTSVLCCEDRWFYYHPGFNPVAIVGAAIDNLTAGRVVRGGSTITMQIARMIEPKKRTLVNKVIELFRALQLEWHYSKEELLTAYFNLVPYGGNIEGVGAASLLYFDKRPDELTLSECATLAAIPVSPSRLRPDKDPLTCRQRRDRVLKYLLQRRAIANDAYQSALREEIPDHRITMPTLAPHFCRTLTLRYPDSVDLLSTIDLETQVVCERLARGHHAVLEQMDIHNLSIVLLDNAHARVLAAVGSPDFSDQSHQGQIDGTLAARSPGSALKPFAYALAFETGLLSPQSRLADIPVNYGGYSPQNYDEQYHGVVSVSEALINSYNVPVVDLVAQLGLERFHRFLGDGGLATLDRKPHEYGLPLALGACEVRLMDLVGLYACMARGGELRSVRVLTGESSHAGGRLLSAEACYLVSNILSELKRPDLPTSWEHTVGLPRVAWKTGTSYGRRDAWAIGYNPVYTVGVWAGNFSGEGSVDIVGVSIAAPLMFDIFNEISAGADAIWFDAPQGIGVRSVCAVSGHLPGETCRETVLEPYIVEKSPVRRCQVHQQIMVDRIAGYRLCPYCSMGKDVDRVVAEVWPARVATWLEGHGLLSALPAHDPACSGVPSPGRPVITAPTDDALYVLDTTAPAAYQRIMLEASLPAGSRRIHWLVDRRLLASCDPGERIFYEPERGRHRLDCVDDQGRSHTVSFVVR